MQRRACDQCYALKKRCLTPATSTCLRCEKASLTCTNTRRQPRGGRPPKPGQSLPGTAQTSVGVWDMITFPKGTSNLDLRDDVDSFYLYHDIYLLGSTFAPAFHRALLYCHRHSSHLLDDIITACGTSLSWARFGTLPLNQVDVYSGARSVQKLRSARITNVHDALTVLMLGQALAAFDTLVDCTSTMSILRYALEMARPWYRELWELEGGVLQPLLAVPVFWNTLWCLFYREIPVIEPGVLEVITKDRVVDRVVGVCTELMPVLYELCAVSRELAIADETRPSGSRPQWDIERHFRSLSTMEQRVQNWNPMSSADLSRYTSIEILSIRTQASMYRSATLLLIHRLRLHHDQDRSPEPNDRTAQTLATEILTTRSHFFALAGPYAKLQNTSFPLLLALLEIPIATDEMWESSTWLQHRPACVKRLLGFIDEVWRRKSEESFEGDVFEAVQWELTDADGRERKLVPLI
ncbi:Zn(II)2Cys6 transcription factor domain-containing protein [Aspergillus stella-maris]|uniref:Zn(II)2Cys6 transcription factor domain-containing protein n=1 Tax=Aspergillus stella-maris TaxID=1810926 RepID=UPI003CCCB016